MTRKIFFALPTKDDAFCGDTTICLMRSVAEIMQQGWHWQAQIRQFDPFVDRARNVLVSQFLASDCTDMVWIDDDIGWRSGDLIKLIEQPVDFVAGAYRVKDPLQKRYNLRFATGSYTPDPETGLVPVTGVGFGFVRLRRAGLEAFAKTREEHWFIDHLSGLKTYELFSIVQKPDHSGVEGEDFTFCTRWIAAGGQVWLDPNLHLGHIGTARFFGCLAEDLKLANQFEPFKGRAA